MQRFQLMAAVLGLQRSIRYCVFKELCDKDFFLVCVRAVSHWKPIINWNFQLFIQ